MTQPPNIQAFISLVHSAFAKRVSDLKKILPPHIQADKDAGGTLYLLQVEAARKKLTVRDLRKFAEQAGLTQDDKYLWEVTELAWVRWYRDIASSREKTRDVYDRIVQFYQEIQPSFTGTDSEKKVFQQYSTSAPIAYLAGWFTHKGDLRHFQVFEPSAGNGLLTIFYPAEQVTVNEINAIRRGNLLGEGYREVLDRDASQPFPKEMHRAFDAILTNPPFGALGEVNRDFGWGFRKLDHVMVGHALDCMADHGRAAILIGGHTEFDEKSGVVKSGRAFFDWLSRHYRVVEMINIDSEKLYAKQGTSYPLRLILVAGRKEKPFGFGPNRRDFAHFAEVVGDFNELYRRVAVARRAAALPEVTLDDLLAREVEKIEMTL